MNPKISMNLKIVVGSLACHMVRIVLFAALWGTIFALGASASTPLILVEDGQPKASILIPATPSELERFAAAILSKHLEQMSGAKLPIETETLNSRDELRPVISIGRTSLAKDVQFSGPDNKRKNRESFRILRRRNALMIYGNPTGDIADQGAVWGVFAFLQMQGIGTYLDHPLGKVVPKKSSISIDEIDFIDAPAFSMRNGVNTAAGYLQSYHPQGYHESASPVEEEHLFNRAAADRRQEFGHMYQYAITQETRNAHPEWFTKTHNPRYGSQPSPSTAIGFGGPNVGICLSHAAVRDHFIEFFRKRFLENPNFEVASIVPDDFSLGDRCDCESCQRLMEIGGPATYPEDGPRSASDLQIDFVNAVARGLEKEFPDRKLITLAYLDYLDPPKQTQVHPNVIVMIAPLRNADELDPALEKIVKDWRKMGAKHLYWYSYLLSRPPVPHLMQQWVKNYKRWGVEGLYFETTTGIPAINGMNRWLSSQLMWNPDADLDELVNKFCIQLFGSEAGHEMCKFFLAWESNTPFAHKDIPRLLSAAEQLAGNPSSPEGKRVRLFKLGYQLHHSAYELDEAIKLNDIPKAKEVVQRGIDADQTLKKEFPDWGLKSDVTLLNYVSAAGYRSIVLPALESLLNSTPVTYADERRRPGPAFCLTNNPDVPLNQQIKTPVTVTFSAPLDGKQDGKAIFDGKIEGDQHVIYQYGPASFTIDLDLKNKYQIDRVEFCSGMQRMEGSLMQFQTVPLYIEVQLSNDGKTYRTVDRILPRTLRGYVPSNSMDASARHIRLVSTTLNRGHEIDEIRVWGRELQK